MRAETAQAEAPTVREEDAKKMEVLYDRFRMADVDG
jgi:hypothetical protein